MESTNRIIARAAKRRSNSKSITSRQKLDELKQEFIKSTIDTFEPSPEPLLEKIE